MRIVLFCHSLRSCWNHGNAHFLRGVASELVRRGHDVQVLEPEGGWSAENLRADHGDAALTSFRSRYPGLRGDTYVLSELDLDEVLDGADLVLVHEWNEPSLIHRIGRHRAQHGYLLLFHDTHHRMVTSPSEMSAYDLTHYDGVLAFGEVLSRMYRERGAARHVFTWHEAADTRVFRPLQSAPDASRDDLVWIGNWGDEERTHELHEFLLAPVRRLGLRGAVHGVRYPASALAALRDAGLRHGGWLPNHRVPETFARHWTTVHVPRGPYVRELRGVPTIRVFEALACGIPLVSAPWHDDEGLFEVGRDFLMAYSGEQMALLLRQLLHEPELRESLRSHGLRTIEQRHTCAHRVDELLQICSQFGLRTGSSPVRTSVKGESACPLD